MKKYCWGLDGNLTDLLYHIEWMDWNLFVDLAVMIDVVEVMSVVVEDGELDLSTVWNQHGNHVKNYVNYLC